LSLLSLAGARSELKEGMADLDAMVAVTRFSNQTYIGQ
jgi:hypothetical protein